MNTEAQHLTLDLWLGDKHTEAVVDSICTYIRMNFNVVKKVQHDFIPQGRTVVYILSESHFTVHTYPEHSYITMDIYICNPKLDLEKVARDICMIAQPKKTNLGMNKRGYRE